MKRCAGRLQCELGDLGTEGLTAVGDKPVRTPHRTHRCGDQRPAGITVGFTGGQFRCFTDYAITNDLFCCTVRMCNDPVPVSKRYVPVGSVGDEYRVGEGELILVPS